MVRRAYSERSLVEVLLPNGDKVWDPTLRQIDTTLDDDTLVDLVAAALARRHPLSGRRGRLGTKAAVVPPHACPQAPLALELRGVRAGSPGSLVYRAFCRIDGERVPDAKTLIRLAELGKLVKIRRRRPGSSRTTRSPLCAGPRWNAMGAVPGAPRRALRWAPALGRCGCGLRLGGQHRGRAGASGPVHRPPAAAPRTASPGGSSGAPMANRLGRPHQSPQASPRPRAVPISRPARYGALGRTRGECQQSARPTSGEPTLDMNVPAEGRYRGARKGSERGGPQRDHAPAPPGPGLIRHHFCTVK